jgi:hypothetical protein
MKKTDIVYVALKLVGLLAIVFGALWVITALMTLSWQINVVGELLFGFVMIVIGVAVLVFASRKTKARI